MQNSQIWTELLGRIKNIPVHDRKVYCVNFYWKDTVPLLLLKMAKSSLASLALRFKSNSKIEYELSLKITYELKHMVEIIMHYFQHCIRRALQDCFAHWNVYSWSPESSYDIWPPRDCHVNSSSHDNTSCRHNCQ